MNTSVHCNNTHSFEDSSTRYVMMSIICPVVSMIGLIGNTASIAVFSRVEPAAQPIYFIALAVYDNGVLLSAAAVYTVEVIYDRYRLLWLYEAWLAYLPALFFLSNMFQCGAIYITIVATCERWLSMSYANVHHRHCSARPALFITVGVAFAAIVFCMSRFWELTTVLHPNCTGFDQRQITQTVFAVREPYATVYGVYLQNAFLIFIPFLCMLAFNTLISVRIRDSSRRREANVLMLVVALTFLVTSLPGFILTAMENISQSYAMLHRYPVMYARFRDTINTLTVINSSINFFIYLIFGGGFRKEIHSALTRQKSWQQNILLTANIPLLMQQQTRVVAEQEKQTRAVAEQEKHTSMSPSDCLNHNAPDPAQKRSFADVVRDLSFLSVIPTNTSRSSYAYCSVSEENPDKHAHRNATVDVIMC